MINKILASMIPIVGFCFPHIPPDRAQQEDPSVLFKLKGILLVNDWNLVRSDPLSEIDGVMSQGVQVLQENPGFLKELQQQYVGQPLTQSTIREIQQRVSDFYASENQPMVLVNAPAQEFSGGVLQLVVTEWVLGEVRCKGNNYFFSDNLKKYIHAKPGKPISSSELRKDLASMNHNPFRRTDAVLTPGSKYGIVDIELLTVDRWPYRMYVGADNTGTIPTMRNRIFFGVNLGKTIVEDSEVSYQYTTAPHGNRYYSHTGMVRVPMPWQRHVLQAFGGYASVEPEKMSAWKSNGIQWEAGLRYRIPMFGGLDMLQEVVLGYDLKEVDGHAKRSGQHPFSGGADTSQFMAGYNLGSRDRFRKISLNVEIFGSPGNMTHWNNNSSYRQFRKRANASYGYAKVVHSLLQEIPSGWRFSYNISGQAATTSLLPSEQMTMTGYNAVRGFEERVLNVDNGLLLNLTVEAPHFSPAYWLGWSKHYDDLTFLIFCDTGLGGNFHPERGEPGFASLGSIGPSIRYELSRFVSTHLDYGFQLWHHGFCAETGSRYNFGFVLSY